MFRVLITSRTTGKYILLELQSEVKMTSLEKVNPILCQNQFVACGNDRYHINEAGVLLDFTEML